MQADGWLASTSESRALSHRSSLSHRSYRPLAALAFLSLVTACASVPASGPAIVVEQGDGVRAVHARVQDEQGSARLEVDLRTRFPGTFARRTVQVEGLDSAGRALFTRELVAESLTYDARYHREQAARASLELPATDALATLHVRAGR